MRLEGAREPDMEEAGVGARGGERDGEVREIRRCDVLISSSDF